MQHILSLLTAWGVFNASLMLALVCVAFWRRSEPLAWEE